MKKSHLSTLGFKHLAAGAALLCALTISARADGYYTNNASATFNVASYWTGGAIPTNGANAFSDNGTNLCLILATDPGWTHWDTRAGNASGGVGGYWQQGSTNNCNGWFRLGVGSSTSVGTYSMSGGTLNVTNTSMYMRIGELGFGTLNITNGAVNHTGTTPSPCIIGSRDTGNYGNSSSPGGVINQFGGTFTNNGELWVGEGGGTLTSGVLGTYNLSGGILAENSWLAIGRNSCNGTFNMTGGILVKSSNNNFTMAGIGTAQTATFNLSGGNITNTASQTWVGETGNAIFNVSGTGAANLGTTSIGYNTGNGIFNESSGTVILGTTYLGFGLGSGAKGTLNLSGGVFNPSILDLGNTNNSQGYVVQTGGSVTVSSGDDRVGGVSATTGANAIGFYNLSGGSLTVVGNFQVGAYGIGELNLSGSGTWTQTGGYPDVGRFPGSFGVVDVSGGTMNDNVSGTLFIVGEQGTGTLNIRGGTLTDAATSTATAVSLGHTATGVGVLNLLGGVLNTMSVGSFGAGAGSSSTLNFNGGTLQARGANATFLQGLSQACVYPGGGTIDSQGNNVTIAQNLIAPAGNGVTAISVNAVGAGYVTPPIVEISGGGGTNATAIALTNGTGSVASILITSPGFNYTAAPTVTLIGGGYTTAATIGTVTIGANATGGLTKIGSGTLALTGASTFGTMTVSNGTLQVDGSLSGGVKVASGTLSGVGTIGGSTFLNGAASVSPGDSSVGTINVSSLTLSNANLVMDLNPNTTSAGGGMNDLIAVSGALTFAGTNTVIPAIIGGSGALSGTYTLISGGTSVTGGAANFAFLGGSRSSATFDTTSTPGSVLMTVVGNPANLFWAGNHGNNWDTTTMNWNNNGSADTFYSLDAVTFDDTSVNGNVSLVGKLLPGSVTFNNNATNYVLTGTGYIGGPAAVTLNGSASVVLANSNSYSGGTTINAGILQVGNGGAVGSLGSGAVVDSGTLIYDLSSMITNTVGISGGGNLIQAGSGTLVLTVSNTFSGFTGISNGIIKLGMANALPGGSGQNDVTVNGKLDLNTFSQSLDSLSGSGIVDTVAGGAPVLTVGGDGASTIFTGVLADSAGTLGLTKVGGGTLTIEGTNTYLSNTFIRAGTVTMDTGVISNTAFGDVGQTTGDDATLNLQGSASFTTTSDFNVGDVNNSIGVVNITGAATLTAQNMYVASANGANSTAQGTLNQTNGTVSTRTSGDNALVMGGRNSGSTYGIGVYNLMGGSVNVLNTGNVWVGGYGNGTMNVSGGAAYFSGYASIGRQTNGIGYLNVSAGSVMQTNTGRSTLIGESGTGTLTLSGSGLMSVTAMVVAKNGSSSGTINLNAGTLSALQFTAGAGSSTINFNGGTLQTRASTTNFMQGLNSAVIQSGGAFIDTLTNRVTIGQTLTDGGGGLTKLGSGLLILTATNTYSGVTTVSAGELDGVPGASLSGPLTVASGATNGLQILNATNPWSCGTLTYSSGGTEYLYFNFGATAPSLTSAPLVVNGDLNINGTLDVIVQGLALAPGTYPLITFTGSFSGTLPAGPYLLPNRTQGTFSQTAGTVYLTITSTEPITWSAGNGNWDTSLLNWKDALGALTAYEDGTPGDTVLFNDTPGVGSFVVDLTTNVTPLSVTFSNSAATYTLVGSGSIIGGTTALIMKGPGTAIVANTNAFAGGTIINSGTLQLGDRVANNGVVTGSIVDNASLVFANPGAQTNTAVISGSGAVGKTGAGVLTLSEVNTYGGATVVSNGVLQLGLANAIANGSGSNDVTINGTLDLNAFSQTLDSLSGSGVVDTIAGGTPTLTVGGDNASTTFNGVITDTAGKLGLTKVGTGTLVLNGNNTYLGQSFFRFGTVILNGSITNNPNSIWSDVGQNAGDNATLWIRGNGLFGMNGDFNVADSGSPTNPSLGTLNLSDNATLTAQNMYVGSANNAAYGAVGVVNQTNGSVVLMNSGDHVWCVGGRASTNGVGTYNLMNGTVSILQGETWIGGYGTGVVNQVGGAITCSNWFVLGRYGNAVGTYNLAGGTMTDTATNYVIVGELGNGALNVSGTGQMVTAGGLILCNSDGSATTAGTVSLNGGSITTPSVKTTLPAGASVFVFNGGILRANTNNAAFMQGLNTAKVLAGGAVIDDGGYAISVGQSLISGASPDGGLVKLGAGVLALSGSDTYSGNTVISNGTLLVNGSLASNVVAAAGTLGGSGAINGAATFQSNATLAPSATLNTTAALTVNGNVTLSAGGASFKLNKGGTPAQDQVVSSGTVNYNGILAVTNLGAALAPNDSFQLFSAAGHTGNFTSIAGNPGSGNLFSFNPNSGILTVVSGVNQDPATANFQSVPVGGSLQFSWAPDHLGWQLYTNSVGLSVTNGWFPVAGSGTVTNENITINPENPNVFFQLRYP